MTRVSDQAKRCGTAGFIPVQSFSATCPLSHFFLMELEERGRGGHTPGGAMGKDAGHVGHETPQRMSFRSFLAISSGSFSSAALRITP